MRNDQSSRAAERQSGRLASVLFGILLLAVASIRADEIDDWIKRLGDEDPTVRAEAADALARAGGPRVERQFREMLAGANPERRQMAAVGLLQVSNSDQDLELVAARLKEDADATVRWSAAIALTAAGWPEAIPWLEQAAAGDAADSVREAATEGAAKLKGQVPWLRSLPTALQRAGEKHRPVLVYFSLPGSEYCSRFEAGVLADRAIVDVAREFVPAKLDAHRDADVARRHDVRGAPTTLVLDEKGNEVARLAGVADRDAFHQFLEEARRGKLSFAEARRQAQRDKGNVAANWKVAETYLEDGREDSAEPFLRNVIDHDEANKFGHTDQALFALGFALGKRGQHAQAAWCLEQLLARWPEFKDADKAFYCLALSQLAVGQRDRAKANLDRLVAQYPNSGTIASAKLVLDRLGGNQGAK